MKITPQQKLILDYLADGEWHCMANSSFFMKDDRKRISELNNAGYVIDGQKCDGRCHVRHSSRIYMRKLTALPPLNKYQQYHAKMQEL